KDRPRSGAAGSSQRAPAEGGLQIVRMHDACSRAADRVLDPLGIQPAAQQSRSRLPPAEGGRGDREHARGLAKTLADEPGQVVDYSLLSARGAVAVVKEEDHRGSARSALGSPRQTTAANLDCPEHDPTERLDR